MKFRKGFVTNSSSSSFICDVCGHDVSGWDMCMSEAEMVECENGHTFCEDHISNSDESRILLEILNSSMQYSQGIIETENLENDKKTRILEEIDSLKQNMEKIRKNELDEYEISDMLYDFGYRYNFPSKFCPICNFDTSVDEDLLQYLCKIHNVNISELLQKLKAEFKDYDEFQAFIKGNQK